MDEQFNQNVSEEKGKRAIGAYDQIIARNQDNPDAVDQALAFKADVYSRLAKVNPDKAGEYYALYRETEEKRANLASATMATKSGVYYMLGTSYWKESYEMNADYISHNQVLSCGLALFFVWSWSYERWPFAGQLTGGGE